MSAEAWVTLATNDSYALGALVLAHSLRRVRTTRLLVVLVTPGVTDAMRQQLVQTFDLVESVNVLDSRDSANLTLLSRPDLGVTFTKLHCWRLTQFSKCVFLDADTLVLQPCDELFEREELSAAPDAGWPDCFNSGVFVYRPSNETYAKLLEFGVSHGSFDGGDQGLLNSFFSDWATKDISRHLPFIYNMCSSAVYSYLPAFKKFGETVRIAHFIGACKPWMQTFDSEAQQVRASPGQEHQLMLLQLWWDIFCRNVHPHLTGEMGGLAAAFSHMTLGAPKTDAQRALEEHLRREAWERGQVDYLGKDSFDNVWMKIMQTLTSGPSTPAGPSAPPPSPIPAASAPPPPAPAPPPPAPAPVVPAPVVPAPAVPAPAVPAPAVPAPAVPPPAVPAPAVPAPAIPAPAIPAPAIPAPAIPAPAIPAPAIQTPAAPEPATPEPATPEPAGPAPAGPAPAGPAPAGPAPVAPEPVAPASVAPAPVAPAPVAPAPGAPAPATPEPTAPAPAMPAPAAPAPAAPEPVAPEPTVAALASPQPTVAAPASSAPAVPEPTPPAPSVPSLASVEPSPVPQGPPMSPKLESAILTPLPLSPAPPAPTAASPPTSPAPVSPEPVPPQSPPPPELPQSPVSKQKPVAEAPAAAAAAKQAQPKAGEEAGAQGAAPVAPKRKGGQQQGAGGKGGGKSGGQKGKK